MTRSSLIKLPQYKAYATPMNLLTNMPVNMPVNMSVNTPVKWFFCLLMLAASAFAQTDISGDTFAARHVWDVVNADWNEDGRFDKALLVINPDDSSQADLYLYLSSEKGLLLDTYAPAVAWQGAMFGTQPSLDINPRGSLLIHSQNDAIGRNRWNETITVAYRAGEFVIAGYTYNSRDTLDLDNTTSCDINFLTGQWLRDGEAQPSFAPAGVSFDDYYEQTQLTCFYSE